MPAVAAQGWLIITRDRKIQRRPAELAAVRDNAAKMVAIASEEKLDIWRELEVVMVQWRAIERLLERPGPFIYTATRTSLKPVTLSG